MKSELTQERLKKLLDYDPETGEFTWIKPPKNRSYLLGTVAGSKFSVGYIYIKIDTHSYRAHRLAWLYMYGAWPNSILDHINGNKTDNRISNLRVVTITSNNLNIAKANKQNKLKVRGVTKFRNKFRVKVRNNHIGCFDTIEEAAAAYEKARKTALEESLKNAS